MSSSKVRLEEKLIKAKVYLCGHLITDFCPLSTFALIDRAVKAEDYAALETIIKSAIKDKQRFDRVVVTKENLLEMFKVSRYEFSGRA